MQEPAGDGGQLLRCFAVGKDDLRQSSSQPAVGVEAGYPHIVIGQVREGVNERARRATSAPDLPNPSPKPLFIDHGRCDGPRIPSARGDQVDRQHGKQGRGDDVEVVEIEEIAQLAGPGIGERRAGLVGAGPKPNLAFERLNLIRAEAQELPTQLIAGQLPFPDQLLHIHFIDAENVCHFSGRPKLFHQPP